MAKKIGLSLEEFTTTWITDRKAPFVVKIHQSDGKTEMVEKEYPVHAAPVGDFILAYMQHLTIPPSQRRDDWIHVAESFRYALNQNGEFRWALR